MSIIAIAGAKGAPGTTTTAALLGRQWPTATRERPVVLVEADPDGGVLALRLADRVGHTPGLSSLIAALRRGSTTEQLADHSQWFDDMTSSNVAVVVAHPSSGAATTVLRHVRLLAQWLGEQDADVIVDVGRLNPHGPCAPLVAAADLLAVVARPDNEQLPAAAEALDAVSDGERGWILVGKGHAAREVEDTFARPVYGELPRERSVSALWSGQTFSRRSQLARAATAIAQALQAKVHRDEPDGSDDAVTSPTPAGDTAPVGDVVVEVG